MPVEVIIVIALVFGYLLGVTIAFGYWTRLYPCPSDSQATGIVFFCLTWPIAWAFVMAFFVGVWAANYYQKVRN